MSELFLAAAKLGCRLKFLLILLLTCQSIKQEIKHPNPELRFAGSEPAFEFPINVDWINTKKPLSLKDLKGKIVLLHFWKYSCINCMHTIVELKKLEKKWNKELVVIGIHSPKFSAERNTSSLEQAVLRYEIEHPVINDFDFNLWRKYQISSWPSFVLIDSNGMVLGKQSGEGIYNGFDTIIASMVAEFKKAGLLNLNAIASLETIKDKNAENTLSFPGKLILNEKGTELFVSDTNHNRILRIDTKTKRILSIIGNGNVGLKDGNFSEAKMYHPQGLALKEENLYIADSENHSIRVANLKTKTLKTLAGTGEQARTFNVPGIGRQVAFNSPWDIVEHKNKLYITMRGAHQIWVLNLNTLESDVYAGSGSENISDGYLEEASFAQPTGITKDEIRLFLVDSEVSAVRSVDLKYGQLVKTIIGKGLFEFGDIDEVYPQARLQYPMGIAYSNRNLYIADTYNNKIKLINPEMKISTTLAGSGETGAANGNLTDASFFEPAGIAVFKNLVYIADTNNHLIRVIDLHTNTVSNFDFQ